MRLVRVFLSAIGKLSVCLLLTFSYSVHAQFVNYGTDPASWKWHSAKTKNYQLIYPQGLDSIAYDYARFLEQVHENEKKTMNHSISRRFPVILHPGNMLSNGMVAYAPRRMELLTTASPSIYAQRWDRQLALHESRHVLQTDKLMMQGVFKPFYYLFGEQVSGVSSFAVPSWFFEGDAVATETAMSLSGRGRLPEFHMPFRAQMQDGRFFSFDKWYMGSYKDHTSTYYALGYHMTAYARAAYGAEIWDKVTHRFSRRFFSIPPFSNALKHYAGVNTKTLFQDTYAFLGKEWAEQDSLYQRGGFEDKQTRLTPEHAYYTSYQYPVAIDLETVLALRSGLEDIPALVLLRNGQEERLTYLGSVNSRLLYADSTVYWTEYVPGMRWTHANYSVLKSYNLVTRKMTVLADNDRLLTPAIRADGRRIAFSKPEMNGENKIVLSDLNGLKVLATYPVPDNAFVKDLVYMENDCLAALLVGDRGLAIWRLDCADADWSCLLEPGAVNVSSLGWYDGALYFESGLNGTNNIYRMLVDNGRFDRLTDARFGAFTPAYSPDGGALLYADYQRDGYRIVSVPEQEWLHASADFNRPYRHELAETVAGQEGFCLDTVAVDDIAFESKPYRKLAHLIRIHSWAPFYYDAVDALNMTSDDFSSVVRPGAMILSQDALNTMIMQAGWYYEDREHHGKVGLTYMGWWPVIGMTLDYGGDAFDFSWRKDEDGRTYGLIEVADRRRLEAEWQVYIPFNLTNGAMVRGFQPSVSYYYTNDKYQQYKSGKYGDFQYVLSELRYYNYRKMAVRDIYPRYGYQVRLQHLFSPMNTENYGHLYAARLTGYLPGLRMNDGLMLRFGYQYQGSDDKAFFFPKRLLDEPRGYDYLYQTRQQVTAKADYAFSLFCPDVSMGNLLYMKRFRSNLFYDFMLNQISQTSGWTTYHAAGIDLLADCHFFRLNFPVSVGVRLTQPFDSGSLQAESLFTLSF